jgi:omega-hydroxy-beta-dihydromenaquinone-9 sulfotransferase
VGSEFSETGGEPIFIGGAGRSGTTVLAQVFGTHRVAWSLPGESRLLLDPGRVLDFVDAVDSIGGD